MSRGTTTPMSKLAPTFTVADLDLIDLALDAYQYWQLCGPDDRDRDRHLRPADPTDPTRATVYDRVEDLRRRLTDARRALRARRT